MGIDHIALNLYINGQSKFKKFWSVRWLKKKKWHLIVNCDREQFNSACRDVIKNENLKYETVLWKKICMTTTEDK